MSTEIEREWEVTERTPDTKRKSLTDQIVLVLEKVWDENNDNARKKAQSTDKEDSAEGSPQTDRTLLSGVIKTLAKSLFEAGDLRVEELSKSQVTEIRAKLNDATRRIGVDRKAIAARKAAVLALRASEPVGDQPEQGTNGQHDPSDVSESGESDSE